jgi:hypothetical protein
MPLGRDKRLRRICRGSSARAIDSTSAWPSAPHTHASPPLTPLASPALIMQARSDFRGPATNSYQFSSSPSHSASRLHPSLIGRRIEHRETERERERERVSETRRPESRELGRGFKAAITKKNGCASSPC